MVQDLHLYQSAADTAGLFNAYNYPRDYHVLVGEYAAIFDDRSESVQIDNPTLQSATSEAVMFLGLERNSDLVVGSSHGALIKSLHDEPDNVALMKTLAEPDCLLHQLLRRETVCEQPRIAHGAGHSRLAVRTPLLVGHQRLHGNVLCKNRESGDGQHTGKFRRRHADHL